MSTPNSQLPTPKGTGRSSWATVARQPSRTISPTAPSGSPWEWGVGGWELSSGSRSWPAARVRAARDAEDQAQPARNRVAAHQRHDDHRRLQPSGRARPRAVRQAGAVRPHLVPVRGRCDDDRGVDDGDDRGPGTGRRASTRSGPNPGPSAGRSSSASRRTSGTPATRTGQDALRVQVTPRTGSHMETLAFYFPAVDGRKGELALHWGTVVVPMRFEVP